MNLTFYITAVMLGIGLAADAFSVSLANGLNESKMKTKKMILVAGMFAIFQGVMPMLGWLFVHTLVEYFKVFEKFIPWIALILLVFIGGKMILEAFDKKCSEEEVKPLGIGLLLIQALATSIDALSVGFTIATHTFSPAIATALIIALLTFAICFVGIMIGKKFGTKLQNKASVLGGLILIIIGIEIFITGMIG